MTMPITKEALQEILDDPQRTRNVVVAAARALNALDSADIAGKTADGDDAARVARNQLSHAFVDWESVQAILGYGKAAKDYEERTQS